MKIVLINGKKRSGKDYCAQLLKDGLEAKGKTVEVMSFADPMKKIISEIFEITVDELEEYKNNPQDNDISLFSHGVNIKNTDFRRILQKFGSEAMKPIFGDDVWINLLKSNANEFQNVDFVIVPDFRFKIEAVGDITINVRNDDIKSDDSHASENGLSDFEFEYYIDNTDKPDLTWKIDTLVSQLVAKV